MRDGVVEKGVSMVTPLRMRIQSVSHQARAPNERQHETQLPTAQHR